MQKIHVCVGGAGRRTSIGGVALALTLLSGCELFGLGADPEPGADAGTPPPPCASGLTFQGECDGTRLRYCDDGVEREVECAVGDLGVGHCFELDESFGNVCGTHAGEPCYFESSDGETFWVYCDDPANACVIGAEGSSCQSTAGCGDADVGTCRGHQALVACNRGQPILYGCDTLGGGCRDGICVDLPAGSYCNGESFRCVAGTSCVESACTVGPAAPDGGGAAVDAGVRIDGGPIEPGGCVHDGDLWIPNQDALDRFYASGCDEVTGNVTINGAPVSSLDGLDRLRRIGGRLAIYNTTALSDLSALSNLEHAGAVEITTSDAIQSLDGLSSLSTIDEQLTLHLLPALTSIRGLRNLRSLGDEVGEGSLLLRDLQSLTNVDGLEGLTTVNYVVVSDCPALTSLDGLQNLRTVQLTVELTGLGVSTVSLPSVESARDVLLRDNDAATRLTFPSLTGSVRVLSILNHDRLTDFSFPALTTVDEEVTIQLNPALSQCLVDDFIATLEANGFTGTARTGGNLSCP